MFHLVEGLYQRLFSTDEFSVVVLGHESSGKSTLLEQVKYMYSTRGAAEQHVTATTSTATTTTTVDGSNSTTALTKRSDSADFSGCSSQERQGMLKARAERLKSASGVSLSPSPAPSLAYIQSRRIRPTVGLNYAKVQHFFSPLVAVVEPATVIAEDDVTPLPNGLVAAPSTTSASLILWDLGGQQSLRPLWRNYYAASQAVVYVVDSTLPFHDRGRKPDASTAVASTDEGGGAPTPTVHDLYASNRDTLKDLLLEPSLAGAPFLILSNKMDEPRHLSLAQMQEALGLSEMAAMTEFYTPAPSENGHPAPAIGGCGFGGKVIRLMEVSALDGYGIGAAMDWLVLQLIDGKARTVTRDS